jgi:lysophospholipid acyltransferase (LPLAT)-like uncharacterized protein
VLRLYRAGMYGSFLWDHDPRLLDLLRSDEPALFAVWHQDFVHTLGYTSRWNPARRTYVLASASRDGSLAATAAMAVGFRAPVRGSTARGGHRALLALKRLLDDDPAASLAVVCDGPRPPAQHLQPGIVYLAQATGRPLWLLRTSFARRTELARSWARFHLPHPGSRGVIRAQGPIQVPPDLDRHAFETWRLDLQQRLRALAVSTDALAAAL